MKNGTRSQRFVWLLPSGPDQVIYMAAVPRGIITDSLRFASPLMHACYIDAGISQAYRMPYISRIQHTGRTTQSVRAERAVL